MTEQDIDMLPAGPELDLLILEKVIGWKRAGKGWWVSPQHRDGWTDPQGKGEHDILQGPDDRYVSLCGCTRLFGHDAEEVPSFSTEIADAWTVIDHLRQRDLHHCLIVGVHPDGGWFAGFLTGHDWYHLSDTKGVDDGIEGTLEYFSHAEIAPLAVCRSALKWHADAEAMRLYRLGKEATQ